jgi:hypothetical protein
MAASRSMSWTSGYLRKTVDPVFEVVEGEAQLFALHELDDAAAQRSMEGISMGASRDAGVGQLFFERARAGNAEVEDAGGEGGVGLACAEDVGEVMRQCLRLRRR